MLSNDLFLVRAGFLIGNPSFETHERDTHCTAMESPAGTSDGRKCDDEIFSWIPLKTWLSTNIPFLSSSRRFPSFHFSVANTACAIHQPSTFTVTVKSFLGTSYRLQAHIKMPYEPIRNFIHEDENPDEVFDPPYLIADGDDAPARHPTLERLWRQGTESRRLMEESQSFTIGVTFKIHTNDIVEVTPGMAKSSSTSKVTAAKKRAAPPPVFAVIDSSDFKVFLYGKSLNELKEFVGDVCDRYFTRIKKVVLNSVLAPLLNWNASVGSKKTKLIDFKSYQEFVVNLGKSRSSKGNINIILEKAQVKQKKNAQATGAMAYIQGTAGANPMAAELAASKEATAAAQEETSAVKAAKDLELEAATIYQEHLEKALGGDGAILTAPWDPNFFYRFSHRCAFIWATAVRDGLTSRGIPPNTAEYKREMFKNTVLHNSMNIDNRVKKRYPVPSPTPNVTTSRVSNRRSFFANAPAEEKKVKEEPISPSTSKRTLEASTSRDAVAAPKKIKSEGTSGITPSKSISLLTSDDVPKSEHEGLSSDVEFVVTHATLLDDFLLECDVPRTDLATRAILRNAGVSSWTDLVPSVQMTANVLTGHGMSFSLASRLIDAAEEADFLYSYSPPAN
ncbi:uncharacterized protein MELLADRAFT_86906 [Melampsora larici-populina 98AG31]|uniref:Uncharacterized protein n=1 Tax=Melampsora larici-populina (strain 98AG31 / pathotype 3-4-7) TaxID=747676 RepID=F4R3T6_MELLP|nr:uncharacterized protein MELLADRAFT_86906 [Melampsora larici-populina 98AG31]EGG12683.1 hypothetical protein MELLADRAFT_86906 [Melampsora larici-populina 98AG31]